MTQGILWKGKPSQLLNLGVFTSIIFVVTIPLIFVRWRVLNAISYEISHDRVCIKSNFVNKGKYCLEIGNIDSIEIKKPFFLKLFRLSNIIIKTNNNKDIVFAGVRDAKTLVQKINY